MRGIVSSEFMLGTETFAVGKSKESYSTLGTVNVLW